MREGEREGKRRRGGERGRREKSKPEKTTMCYLGYYLHGSHQFVVLLCLLFQKFTFLLLFGKRGGLRCSFLGEFI